MITELSEGTEFGEATVLNPRFEGIPVDDVKLPGNVLIMGIRRGGDVIVPHGYTTLSVGDIVMLVGGPDSIRETATLMGGE
jgi:Trk K+ transport system NAD-binding subunit